MGNAKRVLLEGLLVALIGAGFAFLANGLSPRRIELARNYLTPGIKTAPEPGVTNAPSAIEKLKALGLQWTGSNQVVQLFHDPGYQQGVITFLDARHPEDYEQGHIPGAHLFDYSHPENYLPDVFPACQAALQIVLYCNGGDCDDSERAAVFLRDLVPKERLFVYVGGITEWRANALPIELGQRNSGKLAKP